MEVTPWKLPHWNLHHGSYLMDNTPWKLALGTYTMEVTSSNIPDRSYLMEHTPWKLPHGTYILEGT